MVNWLGRVSEGDVHAFMGATDALHIIFSFFAFLLSLVRFWFCKNSFLQGLFFFPSNAYCFKAYDFYVFRFVNEQAY